MAKRCRNDPIDFPSTKTGTKVPKTNDHCCQKTKIKFKKAANMNTANHTKQSTAKGDTLRIKIKLYAEDICR